MVKIKARNITESRITVIVAIILNVAVFSFLATIKQKTISMASDGSTTSTPKKMRQTIQTSSWCVQCGLT